MNGIQGSTQLGTVLTIVGIAGVFIAALIIASRSSRKHEKAIRELAQAQQAQRRPPGLRSAVLPQIHGFESKGKLAIVDPQRRASNFRLTIFD